MHNIVTALVPRGWTGSASRSTCCDRRVCSATQIWPGPAKFARVVLWPDTWGYSYKFGPVGPLILKWGTWAKCEWGCDPVHLSNQEVKPSQPWRTRATKATAVGRMWGGPPPLQDPAVFPSPQGLPCAPLTHSGNPIMGGNPQVEKPCCR